MTNAELKIKIEDFLSDQQDEDKDEFYGTARAMAQEVMDDFLEFLRSDGYRI